MEKKKKTTGGGHPWRRRKKKTTGVLTSSDSDTQYEVTIARTGACEEQEGIGRPK